MKRLFSFIVALLVVCSALTGCAGKAGSSSASDEESIATTTASQTGTTSSTTGNEPKEPLFLETPGGAAIVGKIKKDADGWYFEPEQPLTVKLTYFPDNPELFENLTRIAMFDVSDDGVNKTIYQDNTVTIQGILQNYRGAGTLYFYPCVVEWGKTVKIGYAMPDLDYPSPEPPTYDPSVPLPAIMQPVIKDGHYEYNPYILTKNTLENMGNSFADFYIDFVDAWLSYKTSCPCPDKNYADMLAPVLFYEFPLFTADGEYDMQNGYDAGTQTLNWSYTSKSKAEHDKRIADFKAAANAFLKNVNPSDSEQLRAQALYHAFCTCQTYDYEVKDSRERVEAYYAYTLKRGVCITFACALSQLLAQIGIEATLASGDTAQGESHAWNIVTLDGKKYFCDSTYELTWQNGTAYAYFGMTMQDRLEDGSGFSKDGIYIGTFNSLSADEVVLADQTLQIR